MKNFLVNLINELQAFQELIVLKKNNYSETIQAWYFNLHYMLLEACMETL